MLALEVSNLTKKYESHEVLKGVSLEIQEGEFFGFLGHNGAGKSTTIGIITGLIKKTSGSIKVFGYDLDANPLKVKSFIGSVSQDYNFSQFETVEQVLINQAGFFGISRKNAINKCNSLLKIMNLEDVRLKETRELSGGMKKRMMLARAVISEPKILILDEPTAGVDIEIRHNIWNYLKSINEQGTTIILTTHYLEEVELLCNRIAILENGIISDCGTVMDLTRKYSSQTILIQVKEKLSYQFQLAGFVVVNEHTLSYILDVNNVSINYVIDQLTKVNITVIGIKSEGSALEQIFFSNKN